MTVYGQLDMNTLVSDFTNTRNICIHIHEFSPPVTTHTLHMLIHVTHTHAYTNTRMHICKHTITQPPSCIHNHRPPYTHAVLFSRPAAKMVAQYDNVERAFRSMLI